MPMISCLGIVSTWGSWEEEGGVETDTNQTLWKQCDYTSLPAPSILPQSATCRRQPAPPSPPLLFICFLLFVCPEAENSPCMLNSVSVRARAL